MPTVGKPFDESRYQASRAPELITRLDDLYTQSRRLHATILDVLTDMDQHSVATITGYSKLPRLVAEVLRIPIGHATRWVTQAAHIAEVLTPTGHTTPAALPTVREALVIPARHPPQLLRDGVLDGEHIEAIADTLAAIPDTAPLGTRDLVEKTLADAARGLDHKAVRQHGDLLLQHLQVEEEQPTDDVPAALRNTVSYRVGRDGRVSFKGEVEPETGDLLRRLLERGSTPQPPAEGIPDPRPLRERLGDAISDIIHRAANPTADTKTQLTVFLDINTLLAGIGKATLETGCPLAPETVRRLACDADFIPMVLTGTSVPLDAGRSRRRVTEAQRRALIARDRGCAFPGCCNPPSWVDAHHIRNWIDGGLTDLNNMVLLCRKHHVLLHHSAWKIRMRGGIPEFIPPTWLDPEQKPLRNTIRLRQ